MNARAFNKTLMFSYNDFNTNYNLIAVSDILFKKR